MIIDSHAHYDDEAFEEDRDNLLQSMQSNGIEKIINVGANIKGSRASIALSEQYPFIYAAVGVHPSDTEELNEEKMAWLKEVSKKEKVVAIGEIGLDYHYSKDTAELQKEALEAQFRLADKLDLPVNIHERDAMDDFFQVLERCKGLRLRGNMHAYSGSWETFVRLQKYGDWSVGIGGVVTFKNAGIAEAVKKIPLDHIVLETDAPYLTPVPFRGKRNDSSYLHIVAEKIAELKNISLQEVAETTTANACRLFNISF